MLKPIYATKPFNGRISDVLATHRFNSALDLAQTLERYLWLYNQHLPQKALEHQAPIQALKRWQVKHPELFVKRATNRPGPNSYAFSLLNANILNCIAGIQAYLVDKIFRGSCHTAAFSMLRARA